MVKNPPASGGEVASVPGSGRSSGEGSANPFQYSCLENPMDQGAWQVMSIGLHRVGQHTHVHSLINDQLYLSLNFGFSSNYIQCTQCQNFKKIFLCLSHLPHRTENTLSAVITYELYHSCPQNMVALGMSGWKDEWNQVEWNGSDLFPCLAPDHLSS